MAESDAVRQVRARVGRIGVWVQAGLVSREPVAEQRAAMATIERLGYGSVWTNEGTGSRDIFVQLATWLGATETLNFGTGIANIWVRPAVSMRAAAHTLVEAHPDRLILGIGVGYPRQAEQVGREFGRPLATLGHYLDGMAETTASPMAVPAPPTPVPTVLAAIGPKMLDLAAQRADGAHPFGQPVANTAVARQILGPDKLLIPEQKFSYHRDPAQAFAAAVAYQRAVAEMQAKGGVDPLNNNYSRGLLRLGYTEDEIRTQADRLVDDLIAHGDETAIAKRVAEQLAAGADHVLVQPMASTLSGLVEDLTTLAPALLDLNG